MTDPSARSWEVFFEVYESLPRQGPGNRASAARALALCSGLPDAPRVLDLGCGGGAQTFHVAELTGGSIVALDSHAPLVRRLRERAVERGLAGRVRPVVGDMAHPPFSPASFEVVWSEGALYNIGIEPALARCRPLLRPGGCVAFTDAVWCTDDPPDEVRASFDADYPSMAKVPDVLAAIERSGFTTLGHFTLPVEAWWDDFYTPMAHRIEVLRQAYAGDEEVLAVLDQVAEEPEMHRRHGSAYAYEFFVARMDAGAPG